MKEHHKLAQTAIPLDAHFPEWGESRYYTLTLERLRGRGLGKKRSQALREFALSVEPRL